MPCSDGREDERYYSDHQHCYPASILCAVMREMEELGAVSSGTFNKAYTWYTIHKISDEQRKSGRAD